MLVDNHGVKVHGFLGTVIKTPHATYATCGSQIFYSQMNTILLADVFFSKSRVNQHSLPFCPVDGDWWTHEGDRAQT